MSLRNRLSRARRGKTLPDIYLNLQDQAEQIIHSIKISLSEANAYYEDVPRTHREWDRLRQNNVFKNEADPIYLVSFDAFVAEFGTCTKKCIHLYKTNKHHTTWNRHNTRWGRKIRSKLK